MAARCHTLDYSFGQFDLPHIHPLVSPSFPVHDDGSDHTPNVPPGIPYIWAIFSTDEECHPDNTGILFPFLYYGCKTAFLVISGPCSAPLQSDRHVQPTPC